MRLSSIILIGSMDFKRVIFNLVCLLLLIFSHPIARI